MNKIAMAEAVGETTLPIMRKLYDWLASARQNPRGLTPAEQHPHLQHVIVTDSQHMITTDGYRMHVYPTSGPTMAPGYYDWHDKIKALVRIDDAAIVKKMYTLDALCYPRILRTSVQTDPMLMYSWHRFVMEQRFMWPAVKQYDHTICFRRGTYDGQMRAICLGLNAPPFIWDRDDQVTIAPRDKWTAFEAKYFSDAMAGEIVRPIIRWDGYRDPIILGNTDEAHVVIMPLVGRQW